MRIRMDCQRRKLLLTFLIVFCLFPSVYLLIQLQRSFVDTRSHGLSEDRQIRNESLGLLKDGIGLTNGEREIEVIRSHKAALENRVKDLQLNVSNMLNDHRRKTTLEKPNFKVNDTGTRSSSVLSPRKSIKFENIVASTSSHGLADDFMICMARPIEEFFLRDEQMIENSEMTIQQCTDFCTKKERPIAALSRGIECRCGYLSETVNLRDGKVKTRLCDTLCPGNVDQFCGGQDTLSIYQTSSKDTSCGMSLMPPGSMPLISLASFPGSGNTWLRYLIERVTGIYTGSYYNDSALRKKGFLGERENYKKGNTVVVKTHRFYEKDIREFDGGILIIRNPYDAMLSEHNRKFGGHTGHANPSQYKQGTEWVKFVVGKSRQWMNTVLNWLQYQPNIHVVYYEHVKIDIYGELKKIVKFLKLPVNETRLLCVASNPDGNFKRQHAKSKDLDFDPFTEDMREMVSVYIKSVAMALEARNQEPLPAEYNPKSTFQND